jgi:hypothetical protein
VEVRDLHRCPCRSGAAELGQPDPGGARAGAALTKPGRASTARWRGSGERDGEEYARNRCVTVLLCGTGSKPGGCAPGAARNRLHDGQRDP